MRAAFTTLAGGLVVVLVGWFTHQFGWDMLPVTAIGGICLGTAVYRLGCPDADVFDPLILFSISYAVFAFLSPVVERIFQIEPADALYSFGYFAVLCLGGLLAYLVGYGSAKKVGTQAPPPRAIDWRSEMVLVVLAVFAAVGAISGLVWIQLSYGSVAAALFETSYLYEQDFSNVGIFGKGYVSTGMHLMNAVLVLWLVRLYRSPRRLPEWICWGILTAGTLGCWAMIFRVRLVALSLVIAMAAVHHYLHKPIRFRMLATIAAVLLVYFMVSGHVRRYGIQNWSYSAEEMLDTSVFWGDYQGHFDAYDWGASAVTVTRDRGLSWGRTYASFLVLPVPRYLWPEKPVGLGREMIVQYDPHTPENRVVGTSIIGELYYNFGGVGVLLGMFTFGWLSRAAYNRVRTTRDPANIAVFASALTAGIAGEIRGDFLGATTHMMWLALPVWLAVVVLRRLAPERLQPQPVSAARARSARGFRWRPSSC